MKENRFTKLLSAGLLASAILCSASVSYAEDMDDITKTMYKNNVLQIRGYVQDSGNTSNINATDKFTARLVGEAVFIDRDTRLTSDGWDPENLYPFKKSVSDHSQIGWNNDRYFSVSASLPSWWTGVIWGNKVYMKTKIPVSGKVTFIWRHQACDTFYYDYDDPSFSVGVGKDGSQLYRKDDLSSWHKKTYTFSSPAIAEIAIAGSSYCYSIIKLKVEKTFTLDSPEKITAALLSLGGTIDPKIFEYQ